MLSPKAFIAIETTTSATIAGGWLKQGNQLVAEVEALIASGSYNEAHYLVDQMTLRGLVDDHRQRVEELGTSALLFGASNVVGKIKETSLYRGDLAIPPQLTQALDQMKIMVEDNGADLVRAHLHALIEEEANTGLDSPISLFKSEMSLADRLNAAVLTGKSVIDVGANLTTSRLVNLGFLAEAIEQKIETFQVNEVLDSRTCRVCRFMHGKTFKVAEQYHRTITALGTTDPKELRGLAPWPSNTKAGLESLYQMAAEDMQAHGYGAPPYHPGCRGILALTGTVEDEIPVGSIAPQLLDALFDGKKGPAEVKPDESVPVVVSILSGDELLLHRIENLGSGPLKRKAKKLLESRSYTALRRLLDKENV